VFESEINNYFAMLQEISITAYHSLLKQTNKLDLLCLLWYDVSFKHGFCQQLPR